jgi:hypothetical protein
MARELGWMRSHVSGKKVPDTTRLTRSLGITPFYEYHLVSATKRQRSGPKRRKRFGPYYTKSISIDTAEKIVLIADLDPHEFGL